MSTKATEKANTNISNAKTDVENQVSKMPQLPTANVYNQGTQTWGNTKSIDGNNQLQQMMNDNKIDETELEQLKGYMNQGSTIPEKTTLTKTDLSTDMPTANNIESLQKFIGFESPQYTSGQKGLDEAIMRGDTNFLQNFPADYQKQINDYANYVGAKQNDIDNAYLQKQQELENASGGWKSGIQSYLNQKYSPVYEKQNELNKAYDLAQQNKPIVYGRDGNPLTSTLTGLGSKADMYDAAKEYGMTDADIEMYNAISNLMGGNSFVNTDNMGYSLPTWTTAEDTSVVNTSAPSVVEAPTTTSTKENPVSVGTIPVVNSKPTWTTAEDTSVVNTSAPSVVEAPTTTSTKENPVSVGTIPVVNSNGQVIVPPVTKPTVPTYKGGTLPIVNKTATPAATALKKIIMGGR